MSSSIPSQISLPSHASRSRSMQSIKTGQGPCTVKTPPSATPSCAHMHSTDARVAMLNALYWCSECATICDRAGAHNSGRADDDECGADKVGAGCRGVACLHHHHPHAHDIQHRLWYARTVSPALCSLPCPLMSCLYRLLITSAESAQVLSRCICRGVLGSHTFVHIACCGVKSKVAA